MYTLLYNPFPATKSPHACCMPATVHPCCTAAVPLPYPCCTPIFLGTANYPFGKMQYQQVINELSTPNKLGAHPALVQCMLHSRSHTLGTSSPHTPDNSVLAQRLLSACYVHTPCTLSTQSLTLCAYSPHTWCRLSASAYFSWYCKLPIW